MNKIELGNLAFSYNLEQANFSDLCEYNDQMCFFAVVWEISKANFIDKKNLNLINDFFTSIKLEVAGENGITIKIKSIEDINSFFPIKKIRTLCELVYLITKDVYEDDFLHRLDEAKKKMETIS